MKELILAVGLAILLPSAVLLLRAAPALAAERVAAGPGIARLGWELVRRAGDGNAIISPASVWEALAMTHAGAGGETAAEIAAVLGMPDDREAIGAAAATLRHDLAVAAGEKIALDVADRLWVQDGKPIEEGFTALLDRFYGASLGMVDFAGASEQARRQINRWVADHTAGKIEELLGRAAVTALTRLVVTNAVYLKAPWEEAFRPEATRSEVFRLSPETAVDVPFMHRAGALVAGKVGAGDGAATACEIPYVGGHLAMVLVVPDAVDGVKSVLEGLGPQWRAGWAGPGEGAVRQRAVELALPRWTARKPLSLKDALAALGMKQAFAEGGADFSGIDGTKNLYVSAVVHEGFVDVTEEGTEAAAATGVVVGLRSAVARREEPLVVRADRPFVWAIVERAGGAVLFAGVVRDPRA
ncbi:MAG TPA: serpin family protein [Candidatus Binatia bacterium]|nr:serpin family protein [Candidatus Binatia bacterium]